METLSTPVSSIKAIPLFPTAATPNHLLRPSTNPSSLPIPAFTNLSARARPQSHHHQAKSVLRLSPSPPRHRPTPLGTPRRVHRAASTGYAAALLDVARCEGALAAAERDLRRLVRGVRPVLADPGLDEAAKGEVVRAVAEGGGFYRHVVALVRMLVGKGRAALVEEVMEQFVRLCDELSGTRVVVVMSEEGKKMEEQRLRGIAQEVHKATGAPKHHFPMHHAPGPASDTHDHRASAPSGCRYGFSSRPKNIGYVTPAAAPADAPKLSAAAPAAVKGHSTRPVSSPHHFGAPLNAPQHLHAPRAHEESPVPAPNIKSASPLPAVSFTHQQPPSENITDTKPPDGTSSISPSPYTSSASGRCFVHLVFALLPYALLSLR